MTYHRLVAGNGSVAGSENKSRVGRAKIETANDGGFVGHTHKSDRENFVGQVGSLPDSRDMPDKKRRRPATNLSDKKVVDKDELPDKKPARGKELPDKIQTDLPDKRRERRTINLPDKTEQVVTERRGWIEYAKRGTKNPKRYAYRRRWKKSPSGTWVKSESTRLNSIPPLSEEDYVKRITGEGRDPVTGRRKRDRVNQGAG